MEVVDIFNLSEEIDEITNGYKTEPEDLVYSNNRHLALSSSSFLK